MEQNKLTWKQFLRTIAVMALPVAMQNLLSTTAGMVDTIMIGSQGELSVAAVGICSQINSLFFSCYWGFACGSILFFAQYWGAKNEKGINRTFGVTLICMTIVSVGFAVAAIFHPAFLLGVYTDKTSIIQAGVPYFRIIGFSCPLQVWAIAISFLLRSTERVKAPLICSIVSLIVNFCLNFTLIYGRFGLPKMGVAGAAVGTLASSFVNFALLSLYLLKSQQLVRLKLSDMFRLDVDFLKDYFSKCFPILCNELLYGVGQMIINIVIGHQSEPAIAAMAAFRVCEGFVYAFFGGLSNATSVIVGKEVGAGNPMTAYRYAKRSALFCPMITFTIVLICALLHTPLLGLFGLGAQAMSYGAYMLYVYLLFGSIRTCNYIMNESYRAGGEALFGTFLEVGCLFAISVPATWIAGMVLRLPFLAVFAFVYTDEIIRLVVELCYTRTGKWIKPVTRLGQDAIPQFREELKRGKRTAAKELV